ncbi:MAG: type IV secretion system DNA-binding domain-containing protein [Verrucomicrobia bacterium]|nr:type IV secretion system DNA-binding domain-containing protein [Verrucomicrobiota bacterium]
MNGFYSFLESALVGPKRDERDEPLLRFGNGRTLTQRAYFESVLVLASVGKGKTTLARTLYRGMLRDRFGGLVLVVKASQIAEFRAVAQLEAREADCIFLGPGHPDRFNPLEGERRISEATALVMELAEAVSNRVQEGGENDAFWRQQLSIILRNLFALCWEVHGRFDIRTIAELFDGRANTAAQVCDPMWRRSSAMWAAIVRARARDSSEQARLACEYFEQAFPAHGDRLQGSLAATVGSVLDNLRRPPLADLFGGRSTFSMDDLLEGGRICVVAMPALSSIDGRIANAIMQFSFCRAATRAGARKNPAFLASDECQETVSRELMRKLALLREYKVATVLLTQNLAVLDDKIGKTAREALCGLLGTKIFGPQGHAETRQWAAEQVGKARAPVRTKTTGYGGGRTSGSTSTHEVWDYRVPPIRFAQLRVGESICLRDGEFWNARWHEHSPGEAGTVKVL